MMDGEIGRLHYLSPDRPAKAFTEPFTEQPNGDPQTLTETRANSLKIRRMAGHETIKSQLLCQLSYAPVSGLSFSPGDPPILSRVAGHRFMLQPGSCLPEPLDQLTADNVLEYNTAACGRTNAIPAADIQRFNVSSSTAETFKLETLKPDARR